MSVYEDEDDVGLRAAPGRQLEGLQVGP